MTGIYFLIRNKKIVYVGGTTRWPGRISGHCYKNFNATRFIPCKRSKLEYYENRWIAKFRPELNRIYFNGDFKMVYIRKAEFV